MSYDIYLKDRVTHETIEFETRHEMRGGTYALYGTREAWLNVTYNYARWYYHDGVFPIPEGEEKSNGIRTVYGMSGAESIPVLKHAISALENMDEDLTQDEIDDYTDGGASGYWLPTRENAIKPLYSLLAMAQLRPDGEWDGD